MNIIINLINYGGKIIMARRKKDFSAEEQDNLRHDTSEQEALTSLFLNILKKTRIGICISEGEGEFECDTKYNEEKVKREEYFWEDDDKKDFWYVFSYWENKEDEEFQYRICRTTTEDDDYIWDFEKTKTSEDGCCQIYSSETDFTTEQMEYIKHKMCEKAKELRRS